MISPTPAGLMSEMLGSTPAAPSSAGSADNVARERIAMATEGQARVSPLSGAGHSRAPSVSHQEPTVSSRAEMPAASIALVRRQQQRMAYFSLQCFMESIGEMSSREMWKLEFFLDSVLDAAHKAEFDTTAFVQAVCFIFDSIRFPPAFVGWPTPTPVHPCGPFAHTSLLFPPPTPAIHSAEVPYPTNGPIRDLVTWVGEVKVYQY